MFKESEKILKAKHGSDAITQTGKNIPAWKRFTNFLLNNKEIIIGAGWLGIKIANMISSGNIVGLMSAVDSTLLMIPTVLGAMAAMFVVTRSLSFIGKKLKLPNTSQRKTENQIHKQYKKTKRLTKKLESVQKRVVERRKSAEYVYNEAKMADLSQKYQANHYTKEIKSAINKYVTQQERSLKLQSKLEKRANKLKKRVDKHSKNGRYDKYGENLDDARYALAKVNEYTANNKFNFDTLANDSSHLLNKDMSTRRLNKLNQKLFKQKHFPFDIESYEKKIADLNFTSYEGKGSFDAKDNIYRRKPDFAFKTDNFNQKLAEEKERVLKDKQEKKEQKKQKQNQLKYAYNPEKDFSDKVYEVEKTTESKGLKNKTLFSNTLNIPKKVRVASEKPKQEEKMVEVDKDLLTDVINNIIKSAETVSSTVVESNVEVQTVNVGKNTMSLEEYTRYVVDRVVNSQLFKTKQVENIAINDLSAINNEKALEEEEMIRKANLDALNRAGKKIKADSENVLNTVSDLTK